MNLRNLVIWGVIVVVLIGADADARLADQPFVAECPTQAGFAELACKGFVAPVTVIVAARNQQEDRADGGN